MGRIDGDVAGSTGTGSGPGAGEPSVSVVAGGPVDSWVRIRPPVTR
jgi:hypothetical protein